MVQTVTSRFGWSFEGTEVRRYTHEGSGTERIVFVTTGGVGTDVPADDVEIS